MERIGEIISYKPLIHEFLQFGPQEMKTIGRQLNNQFWSQVLCCVAPFMEGAVFCQPQRILSAPFFENTMIGRNGKPLKSKSYPDISRNIKTVSDFYVPGTTLFKSKSELKNSCSIRINHETLRISLHH